MPILDDFFAYIVVNVLDHHLTDLFSVVIVQLLASFLCLLNSFLVLYGDTVCFKYYLEIWLE